jgi:hypothetical protein
MAQFQTLHFDNMYHTLHEVRSSKKGSSYKTDFAGMSHTFHFQEMVWQSSLPPSTYTCQVHDMKQSVKEITSYINFL